MECVVGVHFRGAAVKTCTGSRKFDLLMITLTYILHLQTDVSLKSRLSLECHGDANKMTVIS